MNPPNIFKAQKTFPQGMKLSHLVPTNKKKMENSGDYDHKDDTVIIQGGKGVW